MSGVEDENVQEYFRRLVFELWRKNFALINAEDRMGFLGDLTTAEEGRELSKEELDLFYANLATIRDELNAVKAQVHALCARHGLDRWRSFTSFTHPLKSLSRALAAKLAEDGREVPSACTQAFCKFLQLAIAGHPKLLCPRAFQPAMEGEEGPLPTAPQFDGNVFRTLHLCEAPGAFVLALKNCINPNRPWDWRMNSLNPAGPSASPDCSPSENISHERTSPLSLDDNLICNSRQRLLHGPDGTGDILTWDQAYLDGLIAPDGSGKQQKFHLITGDGGFDCTDDPQDQECRMHTLIAKQVEIAFACLAKGGNLLLKVYTFFEPPMVDLLATLAQTFLEVLFVKPPCSKPGNSEVYLLCLDYLDLPRNQMRQGEAPRLNSHLIGRIEFCARQFAECQARFMLFNLRTFRRLSQGERAQLEFQKCWAIEIALQQIWDFLQPNFPPKVSIDGEQREEESKTKTIIV